MIIFTNSNNEIKDVNSTNDVSLTGYVIDDSDNPFEGWSIAKICCYKATVNDGIVTMMTPYVDSRLLEHIDQLGKQTEAITPYTDSVKSYIGDDFAMFEVSKKGIINISCITETGKVIPTSYEINGSRITVRFEKLEEVATVTITIQ